MHNFKRNSKILLNIFFYIKFLACHTTENVNNKKKSEMNAEKNI